MEGRAKTYDMAARRKHTVRSTDSCSRRVQSCGSQHFLIFTVIFTVLLFFIGTGFFSKTFCSDVSVVEANQQIGELQYKIIEIKKGDSLWSIAKENMNPGFDDVFSYIHEVKRCNQLKSDTITAGNYLMIPYYE